jgi:superfamily II DNA/RNA helicase
VSDVTSLAGAGGAAQSQQGNNNSSSGGASVVSASGSVAAAGKHALPAGLTQEELHVPSEEKDVYAYYFLNKVILLSLAPHTKHAHTCTYSPLFCCSVQFLTFNIHFPSSLLPFFLCMTIRYDAIRPTYPTRPQFPGRTLIFVNSIKAARRLDGLLRALGLNCRALHAQLQQRQRMHALESFTDLPVGVLGTHHDVLLL